MSEAEPHWLPVEDVVTANMVLVAKTDGPFLARDQGLLESAVAKPRNRYLESADTAELATSCAYQDHQETVSKSLISLTPFCVGPAIERTIAVGYTPTNLREALFKIGSRGKCRPLRP